MQGERIGVAENLFRLCTNNDAFGSMLSEYE